jgi:O-antigen/teichoic acid export membrane protein
MHPDGQQDSGAGIRDRVTETGKHTLIFGIGSLLQQGASFLLLPVYTHYLSPAEYGIVGMLLILRSLVFTLSASMVGPALFRSYYDYDTENERTVVVSTSLLFCLIMSFLVFITGSLMSGTVSSLLTGSQAYASLTTLVLLSGVFQSVNTVSMSVFRAKKWSRKYTAVSVAGTIVTLSLSVYFVVVRGMGITGVIIGSLLGIVVTTFAGLYFIRRNIAMRISPKEIGKLSRYGLPIVPVNAMNFLLSAGTRIVVQAFLGNAGVGLFTLGRRLGSLVQVLVIQPFNQIAPAALFSAEKDPQAKRFYSRILTYYATITVFVSVLVAAVAGDLLRLMSRSEFWNAWKIVPWIGAACILYGARGLLSVGLFLKRKTAWFPLAFGLGAAVALSSMVILIPLFGNGAGAAAGILLGNAVICFIRFRAGQRVFWISFEIVRLMKIVLAGGVLYAAASIIHIHSPVYAILVKSALVLLGYPILLTVLRFPGKGEIGYLKDQWKRISSYRKRNQDP